MDIKLAIGVAGALNPYYYEYYAYVPTCCSLANALKEIDLLVDNLPYT